MAIFHLSIRPISRGKGHSAFAQIAYDTRSKLTDERTGQKHDWSKHRGDVIESQILGPAMTPGHLAAAAEGAEKRYDARVGRAMDIALPHELSTNEQWALLRGFGLQLRDTYGCAVCVSLHHPNGKGDSRNTHGHIFMTARAVDEKGNFSTHKIRCLDDRKTGPLEVDRIREMWETRCNRALKKAGQSQTVNRQSLKAQGIDRPPTKHLGPQIAAMSRAGRKMRKAEINKTISSESRRLAEIEHHLKQLKTYGARNSVNQTQQKNRTRQKSDMAPNRESNRSPSPRQTYGVAVRRKSRVSYGGNRPDRTHPKSRVAHPDPARELARLFTTRNDLSRLAQGHHFRRGQLLVGTLRLLRTIIRILEGEQQHEHRARGFRVKS